MDTNLKSLEDYIFHMPDCILNRWQEGRPTENGGYETKYNGVWYESKPIDKTPKCNCGLVEALDAYNKKYE